MKKLMPCGCRDDGCGVQCFGEVNLDYFDYWIFEMECGLCGGTWFEIDCHETF